MNCEAWFGGWSFMGWLSCLVRISYIMNGGGGGGMTDGSGTISTPEIPDFNLLMLLVYIIPLGILLLYFYWYGGYLRLQISKLPIIWWERAPGWMMVGYIISSLGFSTGLLATTSPAGMVHGFTLPVIATLFGFFLAVTLATAGLWVMASVHHHRNRGGTRHFVNLGLLILIFAGEWMVALIIVFIGGKISAANFWIGVYLFFWAGYRVVLVIALRRREFRCRSEARRANRRTRTLPDEGVGWWLIHSGGGIWDV